MTFDEARISRWTYGAKAIGAAVAALTPNYSELAVAFAIAGAAAQAAVEKAHQAGERSTAELADLEEACRRARADVFAQGQ